MGTAWDVGGDDETAGAARSGSGERRARATLVATVIAAGASLLFLLASGWFATGAGTDYPEPVVTWTK